MGAHDDDLLVVLAAMALRPYLTKLVDDDGSIDQQIADILAQRPVDISALEAIFMSRSELRDWFGKFVVLGIPPEIAYLPERSAAPTEAGTVRMFVCRRGDYVRFDTSDSPAVGTCSTHQHIQLAPTEPALLMRQLAGGVPDWDAAMLADHTAPGTAERHINGWLDGATDPVHNLHLQIGDPKEANLFIAGETSIAPGEIPPNGLATRWVLVSRRPLHALNDDTHVDFTAVDGTDQWTATFELTIPPAGATGERVIGVELADDPADIDVLVLAPAGLYRRLTLRLPGLSDPGQLLVENVVDTTLIGGSSAGLRPPHEWTTPPGEVTMVVLGPSVMINATWHNFQLTTIDSWTGAAAIAGLADTLREDAEAFRAVASEHLDDIDADDLETRLTTNLAYNDWDYDPGHADQRHEAAWAELSVTQELFALAGTGHTLYNVMFPRGTKRRQVLDDAPSGSRIHIHWTVDTAGSVGGLPWTLLSRVPPIAGSPVDITAFLGLRYRIGHTKYEPSMTSLFLGDPASSHLIDVLFWGQQTEPVSVEAGRQREWLTAKPNHVVVPSEAATDPHLSAAAVLENPAPAPAACLYLYCEHDAGKTGARPRLRFGSGRSNNDLFDITAFGFDPYPDGPLVFANACGTGAAEAYLTPRLEQQLFQNGCRAYIGTETKVPVILASRLARVFFAFFEQRASGRAVAAGEALSLARRFLWLQYRNPGGLLYGYVNQYGVVLAGEDESEAVRR